mmetsp:Transcript_122207/g.351035  ORF Transcript_122207/g.351035 Transcript_122207/m.351035 type:complete len:372 (-) Transcript_122207:1541-2656(-)
MRRGGALLLLCNLRLLLTPTAFLFAQTPPLQTLPCTILLQLLSPLFILHRCLSTLAQRCCKLPRLDVGAAVVVLVVVVAKCALLGLWLFQRRRAVGRNVLWVLHILCQAVRRGTTRSSRLQVEDFRCASGRRRQADIKRQSRTNLGGRSKCRSCTSETTLDIEWHGRADVRNDHVVETIREHWWARQCGADLAAILQVGLVNACLNLIHHVVPCRRKAHTPRPILRVSRVCGRGNLLQTWRIFECRRRVVITRRASGLDSKPVATRRLGRRGVRLTVRASRWSKASPRLQSRDLVNFLQPRRQGRRLSSAGVGKHRARLFFRRALHRAVGIAVDRRALHRAVSIAVDRRGNPSRGSAVVRRFGLGAFLLWL